MGFIDPGMWDDPRIVRCSDAAKVVWCYLLTGPESVGLPGLLRLGLGGLAEALRREDLLAVKASVLQLEQVGLLEASLELRVIRIPNAPKYNPPKNPNFVRGWFRKWRQVPDCELKIRHIANLRAVVDRMEGTTWRSAWNETFGTISSSVRGMSKQESLFAEGTGVQDIPVLERSNGSHNGSTDGSRDHSGNGSNDGEYTPYERDQAVKPFAVKRSPDPDPDLCLSPMSEIRDPSPEPSPDLNRSAAVLPLPTNAMIRERARRAWTLQEQLRSECPGAPPAELTERRLASVMRCLEHPEVTDEIVERVLRRYHSNAQRDPSLVDYFDGVSNWVFENFERTMNKPALRAHAGGHFKPTGREKYGGEGTPVPGIPGAHKLL